MGRLRRRRQSLRQLRFPEGARGVAAAPPRKPAGRRSHLVADDGAGHVLACAPLYLKAIPTANMSSTGAGPRPGRRRRYYPKLQCAVPFTPGDRAAPAGPPRGPAEALAPALGQVMTELAERAACPRSMSPSPRGSGAPAGRWRLAAARWASNIIGRTRLSRLRRLPRDPGLTQTEGDPQGARTGGRERPRPPNPHRRDDHRSSLGRVLRILSAHHRAKWGHPYLTREFFSLWARTWASAWC